MNRREILKSGILATGGLLLLPELMSFKSNTLKEKGEENSFALKLLIGALETYILSDGTVSLNSIQPIFAPEIDETLLKNELNKMHSPIERLDAGINVMLIRKEDKIILIDTGSGHHFGENGGKILTSLKGINIKPEDITDIIITHAHIDHIGGILDADDKFIFSNAKYHIAQKEYDFWMSDNPDFSNSKGDKSKAHFSISFARKVLAKIKTHLSFFDYGQELFSCLKTELAEGHTPGHTIFTIHSEGKSLKHIVDTFHIPLLISKPDWGTQWDTDFHKAVETRKNIMKEGSENGTLFMSCHLPWPGLGHIDKIGNEYFWNVFQYPNPLKIVI